MLLFHFRVPYIIGHANNIKITLLIDLRSLCWFSPQFLSHSNIDIFSWMLNETREFRLIISGATTLLAIPLRPINLHRTTAIQYMLRKSCRHGIAICITEWIWCLSNMNINNENHIRVTIEEKQYQHAHKNKGNNLLEKVFGRITDNLLYILTVVRGSITYYRRFDCLLCCHRQKIFFFAFILLLFSNFVSYLYFDYISSWCYTIV